MGSLYVPAGGSPPFSINTYGQLAYCPVDEASGQQNAGFAFDQNGWPMMAPSGAQCFGFDDIANPRINNGSSVTILGVDSNGNPGLFSQSGFSVLGFDAYGNFYLSGANEPLSINDGCNISGECNIDDGCNVYNGCTISGTCYIADGCSIYNGLTADSISADEVTTSSCFAYGFTVEAGVVNISLATMATSNPGVAGQVWRNGNVLMISTG